MKRLCILLLVIFLIPNVLAVSLNINGTYRPKETVIGKFSQDILSIDSANAKLKRGYVDIATDMKIKKLDGNYYIWLSAPLNPNTYTISISKVMASVGGMPSEITFTQDFVVSGNVVDYSINPGIIASGENFNVAVTLNENFNKVINVDFPNNRQVTLNPGPNNIVSFDIGGVLGTQFLTINLGKYAMPALILGSDYICGDGLINGPEICDGGNLSGENCSTLGEGWDAGNLACADDCLSLDNSGCFVTPEEPDCVVDSDCEAEEVCLENICVMVGGECVVDSDCEPGFVCNEEVCLEEVVEPPVEPPIVQNIYPPVFKFNHAAIVGTALIGGGFPRYEFEVRNQGEGKIDNLFFDYDTRNFRIEPFEKFELDVNGSKAFNLSVLNDSGGEVRDIILVWSGNLSEYMLIRVGFTNDENEVSTATLSDSSEEEEFYRCSEFGGAVCGDGTICSVATISSLDSSICCTGICEEEPPKSKAWIGYLIAAIVILVLLIVYVKYKKTGKGTKGGPLQKRVAGIEKRLP